MVWESRERIEFRQLFEAQADGLFRYLYRLARNRHDAEDLLQETFVQLWRKRGQFRGEGNFTGYVRRVAYRTFLNARSRLARRNGAVSLGIGAEPLASERGPAEAASRDDLEQFVFARVRKAVDGLPDSLREPFVLFRFEGLRLKEVAAMLGITTKAAENRVARALKSVAAQVDDLRTEYGGR